MEYMVAVVASLLVEGIKRWFGTNTYLTYLVLAFVSIGAGTVMYYMSEESLLVIGEIAIIAAGVHNLLIRRISEQLNK